ncbi:hypothetical protein HQ533_02735 [Candidatus Woesearchaeota archaeon]|nr:hypothetical protein [Candidatus Woesearchaeota archaeon]
MKSENKTERKAKPNFIRTDAHKKKRLGFKWRKPKGLQNKRRLRKRGYLPVVKTGYRTSNKDRGISKKGLSIVWIDNVSKLEVLDKNSQSVIISSNVGIKKRLTIIQEAKKKGIQVINFDVEKKIKQITDLMESKKKQKEIKEKEKVDKKKEEDKKKKKEKEKTIEESVKEEETESKDSESQSKTEKTEEDEGETSKEKKDFDKLLTKKQ